MAEIDRIIGEAQSELRDRWANYRDEFEPYGPNDVIHEIADSSVPIYTGDRIDAFASDYSLASRDLELAGPDMSIIDLMGIAIYEAISEALWETWREIEEAQDEDDDEEDEA
jgi:hypothetical protein